MFKKYAEVLGTLQLFVKPISRILIGNIPLGFKRESARFKVKMQKKFIANEPVCSDICKHVRQNTFWDCAEILCNFVTLWLCNFVRWNELPYFVLIWKRLPYWTWDQHVPQPHYYFVLWCNEENSMAVLSWKLKYCLGRVFKRKEDILPEYEPTCAVCTSIAPDWGLGIL